MSDPRAAASEAQGRFLIERGLSREVVGAAWRALAAEPRWRDLCELLLARGTIDAATAAAARAAAAGAPRGARHVGRFEVVRELGRGGMGVALLARDPRAGREVVLKLAHDAPPGSPARRRFEREGRSLAALAHPHVVRIHEQSEADGAPYLVMDYVRGESLGARVAAALREGGQALAPEEVRRLGLELASALAACHAAGIVHRDLKPENVILDREAGRAVLVDFGLAKLDPAATGISVEQLTRTGAMVGTPAFMAPEQLALGDAFGAVGEAADVWGLGATLFFALTGETPYEGGSAIELVGQVMSDDPRRVRSLRADAPAWLDAVCAACLRRHAGERPTLAEVARALEARAPLGEGGPRRGAGRRLARAAAPLAALGALALALLWGGDREPPRLVLVGVEDALRGAGHTAALEGRVEDAAPVQVEVQDGERRSAAPVDPDGRFRLELELADAPRVVTLTALDASGNRSAPRTLTVARDTAPPAVSLHPLGEEAQGALAITGELDEDGCVVAVDGQPGEVSGRRFRVVVELAALRRAALSARDAAGNEREVPLPLAVVDAEGAGTHYHLATALATLPPGGRVYLRAGRYAEHLTLSRPVELVGLDPPERVVLGGESAPALTVEAPLLLRDLSLELGEGADGLFATADLTLERCAVRSRARRGVVLRPAHDASEQHALTLRDCVLTFVEGERGVSVEGARCRLERCELVGELPDVPTTTSGDRALLYVEDGELAVRECVVRGGNDNGLRLVRAVARVERARFHRNLLCAVHATRAVALFVGCRFERAGSEAVQVAEQSFARVTGGVVRAAGAMVADAREALWADGGDLICSRVLVRGCRVVGSAGLGGTLVLRGCDLEPGRPLEARPGAVVRVDGLPLAPPTVEPAPGASPLPPGAEAAWRRALGAALPDERAAFLGAVRASGLTALDPLLRFARETFYEEQINLQAALRLLLPLGVIDALCRRLDARERSWKAGCRLLCLLGEEGRAALPALLRLHESPAPRGARDLTEALAAVAPGDPAVLAALEALTRAPKSEHVASALRAIALTRQHGAPLGTRLIEVADGASPRQLRALALWALAHVPAPVRAIGELATLATEPAEDRHLAAFAARAYAFQLAARADGAEVFAMVARGILRKQQRALMFLLGAELGPGALAGLTSGATRGALDERCAALVALGELGAAALPVVRAALADGDPKIERQAALALGQLGPAAAPARAELLARAGPSADPRVRRAALWALGQLGEPDEATVAALRAALAAEDRWARLAALEAAERLGPAAAPLREAIAALAPAEGEVLAACVAGALARIDER